MREQEVRELYEAYMQVHQPKEQMNEEFETWVNDLVEEGYDLSDYTWEEMAEIYIDEAKSKLPTRGIDPELYSQFYGNASRSKKVKGKKTSQPGQNRYLAQQNQKRSAKRYEADMGRDRTPSASDYDNHGGGSRNEETNLFDTILEHLVSEGFADTNEAALAIMANMSEEWRESIVEGMFDFLPKSTTVIPGKYGKNTVLSKKGGVEGVSDKSKPGSFTPQKGGFDKMDAERYATQHSKQGTSSGTSGINLAGRREISGRVK
jgi:hypothetical protein